MRRAKALWRILWPALSPRERIALVTMILAFGAAFATI